MRWSAGLCLLLLAACAREEAPPQPKEDLGPFAQVQPFIVWDEEEEELTLERLRGKVWVADFIFTNCPHPCPIMTAIMKRLQDAFADAPDLRFVSFSVDPRRDDAETLKAYARQNGYVPGRWHFAVGPVETTRKIQEAMKLGTRENMLEHSVYFVLVDREGAVRGYFDGQDPERLRELEGAIRTLLREPRS